MCQHPASSSGPRERARKELRSMQTYHVSTDMTTLIGKAVSSDGFEGYDEWSAEVEETFSEGDVENFQIHDGAIFHKPEPQRGQFIAGIEI